VGESGRDDAVIRDVEEALFGDISELIEQARTRTVVAVNSELVMLYWHIGKRVREEVLGGERAAYGQDIIKRLAGRLTQQYGRGYSWRNLFRMVKFAGLYPDPEILPTLSAKLGWSHIAELLLLNDTDEREFYAAHAAHERWSVRTLRERITSGLYVRTITGEDSGDRTIAADRESQAPDDTGPSILFRDPYVLDFLGLPGKHTESQLETAILDEIQRFLLELGVGFAFVERQKRMTVDGRDFRLDLLLYHITERCYVAVELKTRPLDPGDYGQMLLYLRWLDAHQRHAGDFAPVGLILCTEKGAEQVKLLGLDSGEIRAARYLTRDVREKLQQRLDAMQ
jgi:predicted nuclease of restriction endonuclease-like (RecB) superfamily